MESDCLELLELQALIREGIEDSVPGPVRVRAEIASLQHKAGGHCYLELCESGPTGIVAKVRAVIWRSRYEVLARKFAEASSELRPGISMVFEIRVSYSELYGLALVIEDVDLQQALGEAELRRRRTIARLEEEGLMDAQKEFALPAIPYRIAVISARDAAGYGDFRRHLLENEYGFAFDVTLFEAAMQGDAAPESIIAALDRILLSGHPSTLDQRFGGRRPTEGERSDTGGSFPRPLGVQGDNCTAPDGTFGGRRPTEGERSDFGGSFPRPLGAQGDNCTAPDGTFGGQRPTEGERSDTGGSFPRPLGAQGDNSQLRSNVGRGWSYDAIMILRGGGSALDLSCFDDYGLCAAIARCTIPVYTAIGHDRDVHVADMVACGSVKTPTALADMLIDAVAAEDERISGFVSRLRMAFAGKISGMEASCERLLHRVSLAFAAKVSLADASLAALATRIASADPRAILSRGYALVSDASGMVVKSAGAVNVGDELQLRYSDGTLKTKVYGKV